MISPIEASIVSDSTAILYCNRQKAWANVLFLTYDGGVMVMNLECDTAVSLKAPNSIENGTLRWNLISDRLVLI